MTSHLRACLKYSAIGYFGFTAFVGFRLGQFTNKLHDLYKTPLFDEYNKLYGWPQLNGNSIKFLTTIEPTQIVSFTIGSLTYTSYKKSYWNLLNGMCTMALLYPLWIFAEKPTYGPLCKIVFDSQKLLLFELFEKMDREVKPRSKVKIESVCV